MSSIHELIQNLRFLLKEEPVILASAEDAAYFRASVARAEKQIKEIPPLAKSIPVSPQIADRPLPPPNPISQSKTLPQHTQNLPSPIRQDHGTPSQSTTPSNPILSEELPLPSPKPSTELSSSIRSLLVKTAPDLAILDEIPSDAIAKKIATRWKTKNQSAPISILSGSELPAHKAFLEEIAIVLDIFFGPARMIQAEPIEKEKQWESFLSAENLKLIVMCDSTLWQLEHLRKLYKETPAQGTRTLGNVMLFLLPDLSLYFKDPLLKRSLWKALCQKCS